MHGNASENRNLLIVDDTPAIHDDFRKILAGNEDSSELDALMTSVFGESENEREENFGLTSAMQGQEALQIVEKNLARGIQFAAAFVDMRMPPGWDGLETIEKIWQVDPQIQVVICTAYSDYTWTEIISRIGGDGKLLILKKPFDAIEVRQLARTLCRKWELERAAETENQKLSELSRQLQSLNAGLEHSVAQRTASLQLVLDSTGDGIFTVDLEGHILPERSSVVEAWLGPLHEKSKMWDYLADGNPNKIELFKMAFEQMAEDFMPFEVTAAQSPNRLERDGRTFELNYREVRENDSLDRILVAVRDISSQMEAERATRAVVELQAILGNLFQDIAAFRNSIREMEQIISKTKVCDDLTESRRLIHTLKGNSSVLGFHTFATEIHDLETELQETNALPDSRQLQHIQDRWREELQKLGAFSDFVDSDLIQIRKSDLDRLIAQIQQRKTHAELLTVAETWKLQPLRVPLQRLATQAERIAAQMGKKITTQVDDGGLCLPEERLADVWPTMVHVVRNAADHGLETSEQRLKSGKSEQGTLRFEANVTNGWLEISIKDDGQGIDWDKIKSKAERLQLSAETTSDLVDALFSDGFSTKEFASELSGRGVGLATVRQAAERCGGSISVASKLNQGTTFVLRFPWAQSMLDESETSKSTSDAANQLRQ